MRVSIHKSIKRGLFLHSGRGTQYASHEYQALLWKNGIICSMSRKETVGIMQL